MRTTVNISRVRSEPRQSRAKKAVALLKEKFSEDTKISTELNEEIWSEGIENPPTKVTVTEEDGTLYPADEIKRDSEAEDETDYSEIVNGNMDEVKDRIKEMEDPDFEALIEAEESGKDRKTLKEWIENRD